MKSKIFVCRFPKYSLVLGLCFVMLDKWTAYASPQDVTASNTGNAALVMELCSARFTKTMRKGDTDASTGGDVTRVQKFIALSNKTYAMNRANGIFDDAMESAVTEFQNQSKNLVLKDSATDQIIPPDPLGVVGPFANAQFNFSCGLLDAIRKMAVAPTDETKTATPRVSTTQNFAIPSSITVLSGETSVSADRRYHVTVNQMIESPSDGPVTSDADVTIVAGSETKHLLLKPGELSTIGSLTLMFQGSTTGTIPGKNLSSSQFVVNGARFERFQTDRNIMNGQLGGIHMEAQQSDLDLPEGETATSTDGQYKLTVNRLVPDAAPSALKTYKAAITIQVGKQTEHTTLKSGDVFSVGNFKVRYSGYSGVGNVFANFFTIGTQ
ncbi:MAG: hypothetical protein ABSE51_21005 [Terracidiphilus sp.]